MHWDEAQCVIHCILTMREDGRGLERVGPNFDDLDQDNSNGDDKGNKHSNDDGDGDNNNNNSLLATLKCDDLIAWVTAHDTEPQNKWVTKKEIIKAIMGATKSEHPSKEDVQEIIESCQAKCNVRTA
ncbi:hypothetical protein EDB83DRAFT_2319702 [Lactarius deliciosus]|nr:hypothetical protein EDB83DRAFT_2319702 [Lactarius deliciosus]